MRWLLAAGLCAVAGGVGYWIHLRSKRIVCGEDDAMLRQIADGIILRQADEAGPKTLPPAIGPTPARLCADGTPEQPVNPADWQVPAWEAIGVEPEGSLYFQYSVIPDASGRGFVVRAEGDLDCDGVRSVHEHRWALNDEGRFRRTGMRHIREGE